ncbi:hypothetical protein [Streptomyces sp. NPDC018833]|uniref:hypothetical protein n=1 Tax=Streptomyces sp. NPDC018833 TaxID=3365053 RepID=UPI00379E8EAA
MLWVWCGVLLTTPYETDHESLSPTGCGARMFTEWGTANEAKRRDRARTSGTRPRVVAVLGLSVPSA